MTIWNWATVIWNWATVIWNRAMVIWNWAMVIWNWVRVIWNQRMFIWNRGASVIWKWGILSRTAIYWIYRIMSKKNGEIDNSENMGGLRMLRYKI